MGFLSIILKNQRFFSDINLNNAGKIVIASSHVDITPNAMNIPRDAIPGLLENDKDANPKIVVKAARVTPLLWEIISSLSMVSASSYLWYM